ASRAAARPSGRARPAGRRSGRASRPPVRPALPPLAAALQTPAAPARASPGLRAPARAPARRGRRAPPARWQPPRPPACRQRNRARLPSIPALCRLEFLTKQLAIQLLGTLMLFACLGEPPADCLEGLGTGGLGHLQPCLEHQVGELPLLLQ